MITCLGVVRRHSPQFLENDRELRKFSRHYIVAGYLTSIVLGPSTYLIGTVLTDIAINHFLNKCNIRDILNFV